MCPFPDQNHKFVSKLIGLRLHMAAFGLGLPYASNQRRLCRPHDPDPSA